MRSLLAFLAILLVSHCSSGGEQPRPPDASLCSQREVRLFGCDLENPAGRLSVCGSADLTRERGYLQVRLGEPDRLTLVFPSQRAQSQKRFQWQTIMYSGGWDTRLQFQEGNEVYQLFDRTIKVTIARKERTGGVRIRGTGGRWRVLSCSAGSLGPPYANNLNSLYEKVPEGRFFEE